MKGSIRRILLLGGTTEARQIAEALASRRDIALTVSLAGRTRNPAPLPVPTRIGGFGGADGLASVLRQEGFDALVDATHPFAAAISANAANAARRAGVPMLALARPCWQRQAGDDWCEVPDVAGAVVALGAVPRRVFVALGRNEVRTVEAAPQHLYLLRSVDPVEPPLNVPLAGTIEARGPFAEEDERALLEAHAIEIVLAKNSGGAAGYGKIAAARALGLKVVLVTPPARPDVPTVASVAGVLAFIEALPPSTHPAAFAAPMAERGA
ncbi:cobalt-precorrin-6A reductase [Ancylobacter sp. 6x-1]|uniref:Cobalt-precorrin-6A reductase n=1 Tax=Ancylobacter crimeensis TaxID=2579147 RepID=A0ABT0D9V1_9HYPH|nr:cobalt-precorrin-6A reductase [Ancylobacter crimeensis]MCK0196577.1 cobalt-precorrin-6A reductase [Ancylobacter crimeensis]